MRLVIFDVDGTLVDSQNMIFAAFGHAYESLGLPVPDRQTALGFVGMSLDRIFPALSPDLTEDQHTALAQGYREAYFTIRQQQGSIATSPFFPGARAVLDTLRAQDETLLAVATGKSRRGLDKLIEGHGLDGYFISQQTADDHPSKPHPAMVLACLADAGVDTDRAVMIGDTTFDMDMGRTAGVRTIGVSWGYHPVAELKADHIVHDFNALPGVIDALIGPAA